MSSPFKNDSKNDNKNDNDFIRAIDENSAFGKYYISVCEIMRDNNVPRDRIPSLVHFMSKAFYCLNTDKMENWVNKYIENEKIDVIDD